jgi:hypothetical protein
MVGKWSAGARLTELIALCVIVATSARTGGRSRSTEYRLAIDQLPVRALWKPARNPEVDRRVSPRNPEGDVRVSDHIDTPESFETRKSDPETRKCETTNPEVGFRLPYIDPTDQDQDQPAAPARSRPSDSDKRPMPAFRAYAAIAKVASTTRFDATEPMTW